MTRIDPPPRSRWLTIRDWLVAFCFAIAVLAAAYLVAARYGIEAGVALYVTAVVAALATPWLFERFRL